ncbi:translin-associated protein X-like [Dermacentor silvarum]|uniref:translin-associated protein X-like n=1 Tax=Dermacentor silvarum TaxID=543639 RepID=UPI002100E38B|nr:translin-associated protein X-like [Dermacentor silvarum]
MPEGRRHSDSNESRTPVVKMFRTLQAQLDDRYDRSERLARLGRDVATESRRIVTLLNRADSDGERDEVLVEAHRRLCELNDSALREMGADLKGQDYYLYLRSFTVGLQEYVRAVTFFHYLKDGRLVTLDEVNKALVFEVQAEEPESDMAALNGPTASPDDKSPEGDTHFSLEVTPTDYLYGVADMAGELGRMSVSALGRGDLEEPGAICRFLRDLYAGFVSCGFVAVQSTWRSRDASHRTWALLQNVLEVEKTCYAVRLHGSKVPQAVLSLLDPPI